MKIEKWGGVAGKPGMLDLEWKLKNEDWKIRRWRLEDGGRLIVCVTELKGQGEGAVVRVYDS